MADYLVRVELFGAGGDEYQALHEAMSRLGFSRTMVFDQGEVMALPIGTYIGSSSHSTSTVRDLVKQVANPQSTKQAAIFVCRYDDWSAFLYRD
ncbi:type V toxin-antitoxin system endoribonuclease antitoxin GhoS [Mixta sp. Marseille-Q2659]|uniref:type V toxin-antitoxin system endoribonuclease antitoxin GhoS n=1 Tax=Mixta sp. Marseille-Q2659 TaxID=2736607 RepID=UPI0023B902DA|nr:type V toxin-antitoxin system endoribonuclease antitoxin GhoS [Mixta sp. Marseille-Q2659]